MSDTSEFEKNIEKLSPEDFDGHTEFAKMTNEQKLEWLSNMAKFLWLARKQK